MPKLILKKVTFYSGGADEAAFFHFAKSIKAVRRIEGVGDSILLHAISRPSQESLRDLIALFQRYQISEISQLAVFLTDSNRRWFADPKNYWHRKIFGRSTKKIA